MTNIWPEPITSWVSRSISGLDGTLRARRSEQSRLAENPDDVVIAGHRLKRPTQVFGPLYWILAPQLLPKRMRIVGDEKSRIS
jgi:hypothetical protein